MANPPPRPALQPQPDPPARSVRPVEASATTLRDAGKKDKKSKKKKKGRKGE